MIAVCFSVYAVFPVAAAEEYFHHQKINDVMTSTLQSSTIFAVLLGVLFVLLDGLSLSCSDQPLYAAISKL